jgi:hypothetical protein
MSSPGGQRAPATSRARCRLEARGRQPPLIRDPDLPERESANDQGSGLGPGVATRADDERDEETEHDRLTELRLEMLHGGCGEHLAEEERAEPPGASVCSFTTASITSSTVIVPRRWPCSSTTGTARRLYLDRSRGDVFSIGHRRHLEESAVLADVHDPRGRIRDHKIPQGHDVDEVMVVGVEHVDRVHRLPTADLGDVGQRLPHRPGRGNAGAGAGASCPCATVSCGLLHEWRWRGGLRQGRGLKSTTQARERPSTLRVVLTHSANHQEAAHASATRVAQTRDLGCCSR